MASIPGLSLLPVKNEDKISIEIPSFTSTVAIPESHKLGNCRSITEFVVVNNIAKGKFFDMYLCRDLKAEEKDLCPDLKAEEKDSCHEKKYKYYQHLKQFKMLPDFKDGVSREMIREFTILNCLNHVNIIKSHGPVAGSNLETNYLRLDFCRFSLEDVIKMNFSIYDESVVKYIAQQLFQGLDHIHSSLIVHRDITSENIVFNGEGILKITNFYFSCFDNGELKSAVQSKKGYQAPELLLHSEKNPYNAKIDMWSVGCVLAEFGLKKPLFKGGSNIKVLNSIFKVLGTPNDRVWPGFEELFKLVHGGNRVIVNQVPYSSLKNYITGASSPCFDVIADLLLYSAKNRFSAKQCLNSNYFKDTPTACSAEHLAMILKTPLFV